MTLKKPSDLFGKKEASSVFETPEVSPHITESYNKFVDNFETVNEITEKTKVFEKVDELSERIELLSKELSEKLTRTDLENAMLSQLMVLDENFKTIQSQVKGLNKEDLREFRSTVSDLSQVVDNLVETELPKYKNQLVKSKVFVEEQVQELQGIVEENITGIREEIDEKFVSIAEVIDNNLEHFSNQLQETSSQVKKTADTYNKISKIVENKISQENEKFEEYSELIENLSQAFEQLALVLKEELSSSSQFIEEKFEDYKKEFESISSNLEASFDDISSNLEASVDVRLEDYHKEILDIKAEVVINEQHIKNVDKYLQKHQHELIELREEVFTEIEQIPVGNLQENLERLEKKIDYIKETYSKIQPEVIVKEVIKEGLLNEPPETNNSDSLTPLNQNFVTLDQLQEHYRLFINRIQQQLSTLGGGGETKLKYLDDIVGIATNASAYDGKFLKYNHSLGKFEFVTVSGGGGGGSQTLDQTLQLGNTSSLGMSVGVVTATSFDGNATSATYATTAGVSTSVIGGIGSITQLRVSGVSTLGVTTFTGNVSFGSSAFFGDNTNLNFGNSNNLKLYYNGANSYVDSSSPLIINGTSISYSTDAHSFQNAAKTITFANFLASGTAFYSNNNTRLQIIGAGITVTGTTFTNQLSVSGIATTPLLNVGVGGTIITTTGIGSVGIGSTQPTQKLDVLGNVNISGTLSLDAGSSNPSFIKSISQFRTAGIRIGHDFGGGGGSGVVITNDANSAVYGGFGSAGLHMPSAASIGWFSTNAVNTTSQDLSLFRDSADVLAQRRSGIGQTFRIYNTYTSASQYERAYLGWNNNTFQIGVDTAGISTARSISLVGAAGSNTGDTLQPLQINQTWTAGTGIATALTLNVTDTSSNASSNLLDLRVNNSNRIYINKNGEIGLNGTGTPSILFTQYFFGSSTGGVNINNNSNSYATLIRGDKAYGWTNTANTYSGLAAGLFSDGNNTIAQRNGVGAGQTFRIYNTYTSATNFERANVGWTTNTFIVGTEKGSAGGTARQLELQTDGTTRVAISTTGKVGIGTTIATEVLSVLPKIQILNNSNADGRLIFRAKPGNAYRWNIDNDGDTNNFRIFKEDDANAANGSAPFVITPTGNATLSGNLNSAGNYYVKVARTSDQTINNGSDTLIGFSTVSDGNGWFNASNNRITPTVAGNYCINAMVNWAAGAATNTVQTNIQIRRNGTTIALSQLGTQTHAYTMNISAIATLNGSTDYIEFTAYTGNPTSQVVTGDASGTLTKLEIFKLN